MLEYTYKLIKNEQGELLVTVKPLMQDVEKSIHAMMEMNIDELSEDNKRLFELKILGLKTVYEFLGALVQEQTLKDYGQELKGRVNIKVDQDLDGLSKSIH
jgi:type I restriction-modification system DNA methylase subunit